MSSDSNPYLRIIKHLDELVKSRFIEMFGSPDNNVKHYPIESLEQLSIGRLTYGIAASAVDYDGETRYIRITDITDGGDLNNDLKSPDEYDDKFILNEGDILFARSGATVGKTFQYLSKYGKALYAGYLIRSVPNKSKVLPGFLFYSTKTAYYEGLIEALKRGATQPNINAQQYGSMKFLVPPIELQKTFMEFVQQVDKSKVIAQKAAEKYEQLVKSRFIEMINGADEVVKLGDLIKPYKATKCGSNSYPVLSITRWDGLVLQSERFKKEIASKDKSQYKIVPRNKLVVAFPIDEGLVCSQTIVDQGIVSPAYDLYSIDETLVHPVVLQYYLRSDVAIQYYLSKLRGTTLRRRTIPREDFYDFDIKLPSLLEQNRYLEFLNKVDKSKDLKQ